MSFRVGHFAINLCCSISLWKCTESSTKWKLQITFKGIADNSNTIDSYSFWKCHVESFFYSLQRKLAKEMKKLLTNLNLSPDSNVKELEILDHDRWHTSNLFVSQFMISVDARMIPWFRWQVNTILLWNRCQLRYNVIM